MTKIINLFGGPGTGKSTTAAGLFYKMKQLNYKVELVTEYAKELTYDNTIDSVSQLIISGEQNMRQHRLIDKVDYVITDSPLLLGLVYNKDGKSAEQAIQAGFDAYDNINFVIPRLKAYATYGRNQSEAEARRLDTLILAILANNGYEYHYLFEDEYNTYDEVIGYIIKHV